MRLLRFNIVKPPLSERGLMAIGQFVYDRWSADTDPGEAFDLGIFESDNGELMVDVSGTVSKGRVIVRRTGGGSRVIVGGDVEFGPVELCI